MKKLNDWFKTTKIYWFVAEIIKMFSDEKSFFSKKRVESFISFAVGQSGMIWFLIENVHTMKTSDLLLWAGTEFVLAGYTVAQIQKEKNLTSNGNESK
jgi:hypothetical protein